MDGKLRWGKGLTVNTIVCKGILGFPLNFEYKIMEISCHYSQKVPLARLKTRQDWKVFVNKIVIKTLQNRRQSLPIFFCILEFTLKL